MKVIMGDNITKAFDLMDEGHSPEEVMDELGEAYCPYNDMREPSNEELRQMERFLEDVWFPLSDAR